VTYKKLSAEQISEVISKIRSRYDTYRKLFYKSARIKEAFEERYRSALKNGVDVSNFLLAELSAVDEMIRKEEEKALQEKPFKDKPKEEPKTEDKVTPILAKQIQTYKEIRLHKDAKEEISRLLGAVSELYEIHIPALNSMVRNSTAAGTLRELTEIENQLRTFCQAGKEKVPPKLLRYLTHLSRFPRDYKALEWEEKEYTRQSTLLLHDLKGVLSRISNMSGKLTEGEKQKLVLIAQYIDGILEDFKLKDVKRT
jgi:hypothetical protein